MTTAAKLTRQMDKLRLAIENRSHATSPAREFDPYKKITETLEAMPEIKQDQELYFYAIEHFA